MATDPGKLPNEIDVVRDVSERLDRAGIPFMLTGSLAMNYYAEPRMTRDIDIVVEIRQEDGRRIVDLFDAAYYLDSDAVAEAIAQHSSFNLIHREAIIKVDIFPRKHGEFRETEFGRRRRVTIAGAEMYIVTIEDLIVSKLLWARESLSEVQLRDIRNLAALQLDAPYISHWIQRLGLAEVWAKATA